MLVWRVLAEGSLTLLDTTQKERNDGELWVTQQNCHIHSELKQEKKKEGLGTFIVVKEDYKANYILQKI